MEVFPEGLLHGGLFLLLAEQIIEDAEDTSAPADRPYGAAGTWTGELITRHGLFFLDKPPYRSYGSYMNDRSVSREDSFGEDLTHGSPCAKLTLTGPNPWRTS